MERSLKKIMVVEDDPDIQFITRLSLEVSGGYEVRVCGSGAEAVQSAPAYAPDLILLDVMMPGMDGYQTLAALRKDPDTANIPVVLLTAKTLSDRDEQLRGQGVVDILTKPFLPRQLADRIARIKTGA